LRGWLSRPRPAPLRVPASTVGTSAQTPCGGRAVPDRPASRHGEGKRPCRKGQGRRIDLHLPFESQDLQGNPASETGWSASEETFHPRTPSGGSSGLPSPRRDPANRTDPRPEGRCTLPGSDPKVEPIRRSDQQDRKEPRFLQDRSRHLPKPLPEGNRSLEPRLRRTEARRRGPHPPQSGAFTCREMLARIAGSDNTKLPERGEILCIVSPELHISFTSCPQVCPQPVESRGEVRGSQAPARSVARPVRSGVTLTYVALRSKSERQTNQRVSRDFPAKLRSPYRKPGQVHSGAQRHQA
jgi:hypothetical protein